MNPYWQQDGNIIYQGHVLEVLRSMASESVQMIVTSPPYWGLRNYGLPPMIWDGDPECRHVWGDEKIIVPGRKEGVCGKTARVGAAKSGAQEFIKSQGQFCQLCNAWKGCLGLEPTPELFIAHIVEIFREARRVMRSDGTLWLNLGDSYAGSNQGYGTKNMTEKQASNRGTIALTQKKSLLANVHGFKPKDLCGIPWRCALALQADGWYLRSDIIWHKPNPMPESVTDRPTKAHEYMFLLTKSPRYFYDAEAVKEESKDPQDDLRRMTQAKNKTEIKGSKKYSYAQNWSLNELYINNKRNKRSVWTIPTHPFPAAHFATFPPALVEPCILAGSSEKGCCAECGAPWVRVVDVNYVKPETRKSNPNIDRTRYKNQDKINVGYRPDQVFSKNSKTTGWQSSCKCNAGTKPCVVLDPFGGALTTAIVAHKLNRKFIMIELSESYIKEIGIPRIEKQTQQRSLWN